MPTAVHIFVYPQIPLDENKQTSNLNALCLYTSGFPGYGYLPAPAPGATDRLTAAAAAAAAAAYYADYAAAGPPSHMANHMAAAVPRSDPSPMPLSNSPMARDQYSQRTAAAGRSNVSFYTK